MAVGNRKRHQKPESSNENAQIHAKRARNSEEVTPQPTAPPPATTSPKRGRESAVNSTVVWVRYPLKNQLPLKDVPWVTAKITKLFKDVKV